MSNGNYMCALRRFVYNNTPSPSFLTPMPLSMCVRPRTWAEISIASDRDSAQEGRGVPLVQSGHRRWFSHDTPANEGGGRLRGRCAHPGGERNIRNARLGSEGGKRIEVVEVVVVVKGSW